MNKLNVKLENCYGIEKMEYEFDFSENNAIAIYARNGLMKTSFSKTLKKIQDNKNGEIRDEIFNKPGVANILEDGNAINSSSVFVIKSFESYYESNSITDLLVNDNIKTQIKNVLKLRDRFLKELEKNSGLKISKTSSGKKIYELEPTLVKDLKFPEDSFLLNINKINDIKVEYDCSHIRYSSIFDSSIIRKIKTDEFQNKITEFCKASDEIYKAYGFLDKGKFTLPKLKNIAKSLENDRFFVKENFIYLDGGFEIKDFNSLSNKIKEIEEKIKEVSVFQEIEKLLSDAKGIVLRDIIENNSDIIPYLKIDKLDTLKEQIWISYIQKNKEAFEELQKQYCLLENEIDNIDFDDTQWNNALEIFEERFTVPYKMKISNIKSVIIGESVPRVSFYFEKNGEIVTLERGELEDKDVLSQGEKRALYLLNIIFDVEKLKDSNNDILFIIDDIADSFDYKNKYAIVEYLYEMSTIDNFRLLILSHNFDFYRTVASRLSLKREARLCAEYSNGGIILKEEKYQNQPFKFWKNNLGYINILALIPFVRNIIEYRSKESELNKDEDYMTLTSLLHKKDGNTLITFSDIEDIYKKYLKSIEFKEEVDGNTVVLEELIRQAEAINLENAELEHKIIMAMAIRHKAEQYMFSEIGKHTGQLTWSIKRNMKIGTVGEFITHINNSGNQTRELYNGIKQFAKKDIVKILDEVNIMTPENIHLNSFMYEPLLDMDIIELHRLYQNIKNLE